MTSIFNIPSAFAADEMPDGTLPFILKNETVAFDERMDAFIINTGKNVSGSELSVLDFSVIMKATRIVNPSFVAYG